MTGYLARAGGGTMMAGTMTRLFVLLLATLLGASVLGGCGPKAPDPMSVDAGRPSDAGPADGAADDAAVDDAGPIDASIDAGSADAASLDAGADAMVADAMVADAMIADAGTPDGGGCDYLDFDIWIGICAGTDRYIRRFQNVAGTTTGCPDFYRIGTTRYESLADALTAQSCDPGCLRAVATSVTLLRCGVRTGYIVFEDREMDCEPVYETPDGLFPSVEAWNAAHPCP
jgi:hypothetical protein